MNPDTIVQLNWTKRWASAFSLLSCSYWGEQYITIARRDLGCGFKHILFTHRAGVTTCYRVKSETKEFGGYLAQKAIADNTVLFAWSEKLKHQTDKLREIISQSPTAFFDIDVFLNFEKEFDAYYPLAGVNNTVSDYLPAEVLEKYRGILEDARKYSENVYNQTEEFFKTLTKIISEKEHCDPIFLQALFRDELVHYFKTGNLPAQTVLQARYTRSGLLFTETEQQVLLGNDVDLLETKISQLNQSTVDFVTGTTACPGKAKGIVRIILDPTQVKIFNDGDILVTSMTRPEFLPLMKKSGAIVTDAGGILSHAAIVSRELGKPCVIGTETVTVVFKDGDLVEVDADLGIVRKY